MWRIQTMSSFNMPLCWDECCTWNMFPSSLCGGQMKMWRLQDGAMLSQLIRSFTLNSSGEIQSSFVPWNLPLKHFSLLVLHHSLFSCSATADWQTSSAPLRRNLTPGGLRDCMEVWKIASLTWKYLFFRDFAEFPRCFHYCWFAVRFHHSTWRSPASIVSGFCTL